MMSSPKVSEESLGYDEGGCTYCHTSMTGHTIYAEHHHQLVLSVQGKVWPKAPHSSHTHFEHLMVRDAYMI